MHKFLTSPLYVGMHYAQSVAVRPTSQSINRRQFQPPINVKNNFVGSFRTGGRRGSARGIQTPGCWVVIYERDA